MRSVRVELLTTCDVGTAREWTVPRGGERGPGLFGVFVHAVDPPNASSPRCACADVEQRMLTSKLVAEVGVSAYDLSLPCRQYTYATLGTNSNPQASSPYAFAKTLSAFARRPDLANALPLRVLRTPDAPRRAKSRFPPSPSGPREGKGRAKS